MALKYNLVWRIITVTGEEVFVWLSELAKSDPFVKMEGRSLQYKVENRVHMERKELARVACLNYVNPAGERKMKWAQVAASSSCIDLIITGKDGFAGASRAVAQEEYVD